MKAPNVALGSILPNVKCRVAKKENNFLSRPTSDPRPSLSLGARPPFRLRTGGTTHGP